MRWREDCKDLRFCLLRSKIYVYRIFLSAVVVALTLMLLSDRRERALNLMCNVWLICLAYDERSIRKAFIINLRIDGNDQRQFFLEYKEIRLYFLSVVSHMSQQDKLKEFS